jgi:hypothetical protein
MHISNIRSVNDSSLGGGAEQSLAFIQFGRKYPLLCGSGTETGPHRSSRNPARQGKQGETAAAAAAASRGRTRLCESGARCSAVPLTASSQSRAGQGLAAVKANRAGVGSLRGGRRRVRYPVAGAMHMMRRGPGPGCWGNTAYTFSFAAVSSEMLESILKNTVARQHRCHIGTQQECGEILDDMVTRSRVEIKRFNSPKITHTPMRHSTTERHISSISTSASGLVSLHEQVWYAEIIVCVSLALPLFFSFLCSPD